MLLGRYPRSSPLYESPAYDVYIVWGARWGGGGVFEVLRQVNILDYTYPLLITNSDIILRYVLQFINTHCYSFKKICKKTTLCQ